MLMNAVIKICEKIYIFQPTRNIIFAGTEEWIKQREAA